MEDPLSIRKHATNTTMHTHIMLWISNINVHATNINSNKCNNMDTPLLKSNQNAKWQRCYVEKKRNSQDLASNVII